VDLKETRMGWLMLQLVATKLWRGGHENASVFGSGRSSILWCDRLLKLQGRNESFLRQFLLSGESRSNKTTCLAIYGYIKLCLRLSVFPERRLNDSLMDHYSAKLNLAPARLYQQP
jgi:hypothetical protein